MLSRFISKSSHFRLLALIPSQYHCSTPKPFPQAPPISILYPIFFPKNPSFFSTNRSNNGDDSFPSKPDVWKLSSEQDEFMDSIFSKKSGNLEGFQERDATVEVEMKLEDRPWSIETMGKGNNGDNTFKEFDEKGGAGGGAVENEEWATADGFKPWSFGDDDKVEQEFFNIGSENIVEGGEFDMKAFGGELPRSEKSEEEKQLESEEKALTAVLKGPNRAFGDLIAASGITEAMLDSLMALKDLEDIQGLPPLSEIEEIRYEKNTRGSSRAEIERQKQEEVAMARVRQVDEKGRSYGTGRRKCSSARVFIQPGDGKIIVNDKEFDVYFPVLDHRATLLRPFTETKTLGMWDVKCTVKGGGVSGQVGAIQLGISRALQNWDPQLRPPLREGGLLTRDSRVVERKKPGKAKARKSFQWVKR